MTISKSPEGRAMPLVVSIIGRPNVGKSSLFNRLTGRQNRSLTHDQNGVTRDTHYAKMVADTR